MTVVDQMEHICGTCDKPAEFYPSDVSKNNWSRCKACRKTAYQDWYGKNPEKLRKYEARKYAKPGTRTRVSKYRKQKRRNDPSYQKAEARANWLVRLRLVFGITEDDYNRMFDEQGGVCAICQHQETERRMGRVKRLAIDHDHGRKTIRGLLCSRCNRAMGLFEDVPERAEMACQYLTRTHGILIEKVVGRRASLSVGVQVYDQLFREQGGVCAICQLPERGRNKGLSVDHCHKTMRVRGLLCSRCNTALGLFMESPDFLHAVSNYLRHHAGLQGRKMLRR